MYIVSVSEQQGSDAPAQEVLITSEASNKVLMRQHQVLISIHKKQKLRCINIEVMAPPAGIEPTTDP